MRKFFSLALIAIASSSYADVDLLRSSDRPQLTEKPQTVGSGRFQIEGSALEYGFEKAGKFKRHNVDVLGIAAKYGITDVLDVFGDFDVFRHFNPSLGKSKSGLGDLSLGAEYNLWGNADYNSALSLTPFIKIPTNTHDYTNNAVEFGVKAPFSLELKDEFTFGAMLELDLREDVLDADGYHLELINAVSISKPIADPLALYAEYFSHNTFEDNQPWIALLGLGAVYAAADRLLVDASLRLGLSEGAEDVRLLTGASYRF